MNEITEDDSSTLNLVKKNHDIILLYIIIT